MPEELEFRFGSLYCPQCGQSFPYRTHVVVGSQEEDVYKCPECGGMLQEARSEQFMDNSDDTMYIMYQLDNEIKES